MFLRAIWVYISLFNGNGRGTVVSVGGAVSFFLGDCHGALIWMCAPFLQHLGQFRQYRKCFPLVIGDSACLSLRRSCSVKDVTRFV